MAGVLPGAPGPAAVSIDRPATFGDALWSEWTKLRTLRATGYAVLATGVLGILMAVATTRAIGSRYPNMSSAGHAEFDPTVISLVGGCVAAQQLVGALGVLLVTSEYTTGTIGTSLTTVPRRGRLLAAKALVLCPIALLIGEVIAFGAFWAGQLLLADAGLPHASLGQPGVLRAVIGAGQYITLAGLLGVALGFLVRSTAWALVILAMATTVPFSLGELLPMAVKQYWLCLAGIQILKTKPSAQYLSPWTGLGVMSAEVVLVLLAALVAFRRRDL